MSQDAKTLLYWVSNAECNADNAEDDAYCLECARKWAAFIISS